MSIGEIALSKADLGKDSYVIFDVNDALRRTYLQRSLIVIPNVIASGSLVNDKSEVYELPGRNNFLIQVTAALGSPSGFAVLLQGSLFDKNDAHDSGNWLTIGTHNAIGFHAETSNIPFRYYRVIISNAVTTPASNKINVHLSAIGY